MRRSVAQHGDDQSVQVARHEIDVAGGDLVEGPPSQFVDELGVHLLPRQPRLGVERIGTDEVDLFSLAIELAIEERHDVQSVPDLRSDDCADQADLFLQLPVESLYMALTRLEPATWQSPSSCRGELEPHQQHSFVGVDNESADGVADAQICGRIASRIASRVDGHSSGALLRPSLNIRYIS